MPEGDNTTPSSERPSSARASAADGADRNLLFGIIALQNDFITREAFVAAFDSWAQDKTRPLAAILERQGALSAEDREILERLVLKFLEKHGGDAERSLAALSSVPQVRPELQRLNDPGLDATLAYVGRDRTPDAEVEFLPPATGSTSLGRFRILRPHAWGGLGQVSVALDQDLNREVALKEIQPEHADDKISRERFVMEAEITGSLEHPGIVPVYALGHGPDGRPFYAMRFVKGDSLKHAIEEFHRPDNPDRRDPGARQLALRQLLGRFIDVCNAMEYAHSRGVLHRDLKPGNIMVGKYGETLIVDWGLAKSVGRKEIISDEATLRPSSAISSSGQTQAGSAIGTPAYMSPEQASGKLEQLGPASDVYSLGATLYHLLCGRPPFEKNVSDILERVQRGEFARPRTVVPGIPAPLEAICLKAMALRPADRYEAARALSDDLEHWLADEPVVAAPDSPGDRVSRFSRKHRGFVQTGAAATFLVAIVSTIAALLINESRKESAELASKNERLANEKSNLADSEREAKTKAQQLADDNGRLAGNEREARQATERQLQLATAERLAALSHAKRSESPDLSLTLAIESGRAARSGEGSVLASSHQALFDSLSAMGGCPLIGHNDRISRVAISPDGHWIISASEDHTVRIWDLTARNPAASPRVLGGEYGDTIAVAVTADSRWIVTASFAALRLWDLSAENPAANPRVLPGQPGWCRSIAVSADSRLVVTGGDNVVRIWDLTAEGPAAGPRILPGHDNSITSVSISRDSRWIVTGSEDRTARVWDLTADDPGDSPRVLEGHLAPVTSVAVTPDGRRVLTGSEDRTARMWDLTADDPGADPYVLKGHQGFVTSVAVSADGNWIVTGSTDSTARLWDLRSAEPAVNPRVLSGHSAYVQRVAISPDSRWIVTGSADRTARVWDVTADNPAAMPRVLTAHQGGVSTVAISPDSRWVVTGAEDNTLRLWDLKGERFVTTPRVLRVSKPHMVTATISPDSRWVITGSEEDARVWNLGFGESDREHILPGYRGVVWSLAISPDGRWAVAGCQDNTARVWELSDAHRDSDPRLLTGHTADVYSVAVSPNGRWILTGSGDNTARLWDMTVEDPAANPHVLTGHSSRVMETVVSPDSHWGVTISIGVADEARVWNFLADDPSASPLVLPSKTSCAVFTPDSRWLVSGSKSDNAVRIWDLSATDPVSSPRILKGHAFGIAAVAISRDGRWLVTGSLDKTVRVWDLTAEDPALTAHVLSGHQGSITSVAISPDGRWIATGSFDRTIRLWDANSANPGFAPRVLHGHESAINGVLFSPDGHQIVTWSYDLTARLWTWRWDDLVDASVDVGRNLSRDEWTLYFPGEPYRKTFPDRLVPGDPETAIDFIVRGTKRSMLNELEGAIEDYSQALRLDPNSRSACAHRAEIRRLTGRLSDALSDYSEAIRLDPTNAASYNSRAWLQATINDERFRDGEKAIADATRACELTNWKAWRYLDTLAAAYAESGDFDEAVKWQEKAEEVAPDGVQAQFGNRLQLYKSGRPYRETPQGQPD